jgi:hypothetical protein
MSFIAEFTEINNEGREIAALYERPFKGDLSAALGRYFKGGLSSPPLSSSAPLIRRLRSRP